MEKIKPLIPLSALKTTLMMNAAAHGQKPAYSNYDQRVDTLTQQLVPPGGNTFIYYIDGDIALVCDMDTLEVVGFQIEGFVKQFLLKQANQDLAKVHAPWRIPEFA